MMSADSVEFSFPFRSLRPLVVILGPTAVGKTQIALQIAVNFSAEIVSADSRLLYVGMDIGTAKPTFAERARVPHHLIDVATPDNIWSLAQYKDAAIKAIDSILHRNHLPILVGGSGQYIHAVTKGWEIPPVPPNPSLRSSLEIWASQIGYQALYNRLASIDPQAAATIDPPNIRRTIRAIEVIFTTGQLFSEQRRFHPPSYSILQLGIHLPRPQLYQRIDERVNAMIQSGFTQEVQQLLDQGYSTELPTLSAIGYAEIAAFLKGEFSLEEAITQIKRRTRIFVRRQANWFKLNDPNIHWFTADSETDNRINKEINNWLTLLSKTSNYSQESRS